MGDSCYTRHDIRFFRHMPLIDASLARASTGTERNGIISMATVTKARSTIAGAAKTTTKPLGAKTPTTPVTAKGGAFAKGAPQSAVPRPKMSRFLIGMVAYLIGAQVLTFLLQYLNIRNKWNLEHKVLFSLPLLGNVSAFTLLYILSLAGLLYALYRFRILPSAASLRDQQANATVAARGGSVTKSATAARGTLAKPAAGKARVDAKNTTVGKPTSGKAATATAGANTKGTAKKAADTAVDETEPGEHDDLYQQVRSQMRAQARKRKR